MAQLDELNTEDERAEGLDTHVIAKKNSCNSWKRIPCF